MINSANIPRAYSEVYAFMNAIGQYYINKVPKRIYENIEKNRDKSYNPIYNENQKMTKDIISKEALSLIAGLNLQYWCEDPQEKERLKKVYYENSKREEEKYSYDNIFKNNEVKKIEQEEPQNENTQMIEIKEETIFAKLISKIKKFFAKFKK